MTTPIIDKITLLLNKAEGAATPEEAEAYFEKAQQIATKYAIDEEEIRAASGGQATSKLTSKTFKMGERRTFGLYTFVELFSGIAYANDVRIAVAHNSTYVVAYGYDTDIAIVETLFNSLLVQMTQAAVTYINKGEYKNEKIWRDGYWENYGGARGREWVEAGYKPVHGSTARLTFQRAFAERVGQRLYIARKYAMNQAETASPGTGAELVLVRKADAVSKHFDATANVRGSWNGGQNAATSTDARRAGREAGDKARIGTGSVTDGSKGQLR